MDILHERRHGLCFAISVLSSEVLDGHIQVFSIFINRYEENREEHEINCLKYRDVLFTNFFAAYM